MQTINDAKRALLPNSARHAHNMTCHRVDQAQIFFDSQSSAVLEYIKIVYQDNMLDMKMTEMCDVWVWYGVDISRTYMF